MVRRRSDHATTADGVRDVFLTRWDPIGVGDVSPDEYDAYANRAYVMMMYEEATQSDLAHYLHYTATEYMGVETPFARSEETAKALYALKDEFQRRTQ